MPLGPVDEIKAKVDIVDLIGESVPLKKAGRNFSAPCPFHSERTPSFFVFPDRQSWRCFGACATGGDIFNFVMRRENMQFPEALRLLAQRASVTLPSAQAGQERASRAERLKGVNRAAAIFFQEALLTSKEGSAARAHLQERGVSAEAIELFRLGYCPEERRALERSLESQGFTATDWVAAGLIRNRDDGSWYNLFHGRLMIPILDERSDYLAFGARTLNNGQPKYLNSPQSEVFEKGALLYGIHRAKEGIRQAKHGVIVEGYMDVIAAHQYGFENVVAPMGTALTERQVATLTRLASRFVLALDPDAAGDEATLRSLESSWRIMDQPANGVAGRLTGNQGARPELFVIDLPRGKDPDDVIKESRERWQELVTIATPVIDYVFRAVVARSDIQTAAGKAAVTDRLAPLVRNAPSVFERNERIAKLAQLLGERENVVHRAIGDAANTPRRTRNSSAINATAFDGRPKDSYEPYCLATLLRFPELIPAARALNAEHFLEAHHRELFRLLMAETRVEEIPHLLDGALASEYENLMQYPLQPGLQSDRALAIDECVARLEERLLHLKLQAIQSRYQVGELNVDEASTATESVNVELRRLHATRRARPSLTI